MDHFATCPELFFDVCRYSHRSKGLLKEFEARANFTNMEGWSLDLRHPNWSR